MNKVTMQAPAKVNLYLDITGTLPNGYHTIQTIFQTVSLFDTLTIQKTVDPEIILHVKKEAASATLCPANQDNIVCKAARLFFDVFKISAGCKMTLTKRIPVQAGLGGGSSDAAAALRGLVKLFLLNQLTKTQIKKLHAIALTLGADVPFFLSGGLASASGVGEKIKPLNDLPKFWLVIVKPESGLSTPQMYRDYDKSFASKNPSEIKEMQLTAKQNLAKINSLIKTKVKGTLLADHLYNAFEPVAFVQLKELKQLQEELLALGARGVLMSGSGSAMFALTTSQKQALAICKKIKSPTQAFCAYNVTAQPL